MSSTADSCCFKNVSWDSCFINPPKKSKVQAVWLSVEEEEACLSLARQKFKDWQQQSHREIPLPKGIPRVIHQIWFGDETKLGEKEQAFRESWKRYNDDFEFKWWTEAAIKDAFQRWGLDYKPIALSPNAGEKSDIARYAILYHLGGVYVDIDFECIKAIPTSLLNGIYEVVAGLANVSCTFEVANSWIAAIPGSEMIHSLYRLASLPESNTNRLIESYSGVSYHNTISRTGPGLMTKVWHSHLHHNWLLLPPSFLYPVPNDLQVVDRSQIARCETFAIHWWHKSWL